MTRIFTPFITQNLDNDRWIRLCAVFEAESDVLKKYGYKSSNKAHPYRFRILIDFTQDGESVPIIRGRNKRGGLVHDYFSCYDSDPVVPKWIAALIYLEFNAYCDSIDSYRFSEHLHPLVPKELIVPVVLTNDFARRWSKFAIVSVWPGYFHKRSIYATCEDLAGIKGDEYITVEKLEELIVKQEAVTAGIKDAPVEQTPELVEASEMVTEDLKDAKADLEATPIKGGTE